MSERLEQLAADLEAAKQTADDWQDMASVWRRRAETAEAALAEAQRQKNEAVAALHPHTAAHMLKLWRTEESLAEAQRERNYFSSQTDVMFGQKVDAEAALGVIRLALHDEIEMQDQAKEQLGELKQRWRQIIHEVTADGEPLIEEMLRSVIDDITVGDEARALALAEKEG